jgi:hypothetical protein
LIAQPPGSAPLLLRSAQPVDWERLTQTVCELDLVPYLRSALGFLRWEPGAPVPDEALGRLERASSSLPAATEFAREVNPAVPRTAWQDLLWFYSRWRRSLGGASPLLHAAGSVRHLQYAFEVDSRLALAGRLAQSAVTQLRSRR